MAVTSLLKPADVVGPMVQVHGVKQVEGCDKFAQADGHCIAHGGEKQRKRCEVDGCDKYAKSGGRC